MKRYGASRTRPRESGFSLIEAMVGITLGIITVLIITQTFATFEANKSTTTAGADAQENGLVALDILSQDARNAGVGLADNQGAWDCANFYAWKDDGNNPPAPYALNTAPATITDGGAGASDTVTFRTGQSFLGSIPTYLTSAMPQPSSELNVNRTQGFKDGDRILVTQGGNCTLMMVTQVQAAALKLQHNPGNAPTFNPSAVYQNANAWPAYSDGAKIYNMGNVVEASYSVNADRNLQVVINSLDAVAVQTLVMVREIVALQAQYGVANAGSDVVNAWVDATGTWSALDASEVKRIKAVRLVVVARAGKREAAAVTANVPTIRTSPLDPTPVAIPGVSALAEWQNYRYKVYETVIPLRNILWADLT